MRVLVPILLVVALMAGMRFVLLSPLDRTIYAAAYIESNFRKIRLGMTEEEVVALLGLPLETRPFDAILSWVYAPVPQPDYASYGQTQGTFTLFIFSSAKRTVVSIGGWSGQETRTADGALVYELFGGRDFLGIQSDSHRYIGWTEDDVLRKFGEPTARREDMGLIELKYSRQATATSNYHRRRLRIDAQGRVSGIEAYFHYD